MRTLIPARLAVLLAVPLALLGMPSPAAACEQRTFSIQLTNLVVNDVTPFYYAEEGDDAGPEFVVAALGGVCPPDEGGQVDYDTPPSGTNPAEASPVEVLGDYQRTSGFSTFAANGVSRDEVDVPLHDDTTAEDTAAETFTVQLSNARGLGATMGTPSSAPFFIVDEEGPHRARFVAGAATVFENREVFESEALRIPVLRAGPEGGSVTFSVNAPNDASEGEVVPQNGEVQFREDGRLGFVRVSVDDDQIDEPNEVFTISLGVGGDAPATFELTVDDNDLPGGGDEDDVAPVAWFHHPRHGETYRQGSFGADSIHLFVREEPLHSSSRIAWGKIALRKKMRSGACKWWKNGGWRAGACGVQKWVGVGTHFNDGGRELFIYTAYPSLTPSIGTRVRNYTVFGRGSDISGNRSPLRVGDNISTFEVRPR